MSPEDLVKIIKEIPTLIMYIAPGYLTLWTIDFTLSRKSENNEHLVLKSVIISYLLIILVNAFTHGDALNSKISKIGILIGSLVIGYIVSRIIISNVFSKGLRKLGITRSVHEKSLNDIIDFDKGVLVVAYLPNDRVIYKGDVRFYDDKVDSGNAFIVIANYVQYNYDGEEKVNCESQNENRVLLNFRDISRMELYYNPESKKIIY